MAVGTTTAIALTLLGGAAAAGASKLMAPKTSAPALPQLPSPPSAVDAVAKADEAIRRRKSVQTQSVFTNPLGVAGQAEVAKKTLTGQ